MLRIGIKSKTDIEYGEILSKVLEIDAPFYLRPFLNKGVIEKLSSVSLIKKLIIKGINEKIEGQGFAVKISDIELKNNEIAISSAQTSKADIENELKKLLNNFLQQKGILEKEINLEKVSLTIDEQRDG